MGKNSNFSYSGLPLYQAWKYIVTYGFFDRDLPSWSVLMYPNEVGPNLWDTSIYG